MALQKPEDEERHDFLSIISEIMEFFETTERLLSVLAGFFLAVVFSLMPFSELGKNDPWYFWVGSGLIALILSFVLSWAFFPPKKRKTADSPDTKTSDQKDSSS